MTRHTVCSILSALILIGTVASPVSATPSGHSRKAPVYYLSLGTSLAAGMQADPLTGQSVVTDVSYPGKLTDLLREEIPTLRDVNLACPGETAASFIDGGRCAYPQGSQLDQALQFLNDHARFTDLITIDLGANDVLGCVSGREVDQRRLIARLADLSSDLAYILTALREAAPHVPIVGMNYYNLLLVHYGSDPDFATSTIVLQMVINLTLEKIYANYAVRVADVAGTFRSYDLVSDDDGNGWPDSLELLCAWTWMCTHANIHANADGYTAIAEAFYAVLPDPGPPRHRFRPVTPDTPTIRDWPRRDARPVFLDGRFSR